MQLRVVFCVMGQAVKVHRMPWESIARHDTLRYNNRSMKMHCFVDLVFSWMVLHRIEKHRNHRSKLT